MLGTEPPPLGSCGEKGLLGSTRVAGDWSMNSVSLKHPLLFFLQNSNSEAPGLPLSSP